MIKASTYKKAKKFATSWPTSKSGGSKKVRAAAALIRWFHGQHYATKEPSLPDGSSAAWETLDRREALAVLALSHDWLKSTPHEASELAGRAIFILQACRYAIGKPSADHLISAFQISSMSDAAKVSEKIEELYKSGEWNTDLTIGLMGALNTWLKGEANGWIEPEVLREYRNVKAHIKKRIVTKSQVARKINKTYRQYLRYENGETPVPQNVAIELFEYLLPITPLLPKTTPPPPRGAMPYR